MNRTVDVEHKELLTIGIDIGGTKVDTALIDKSGKIISTHYRLLDPTRDAEKTIAAVIDSIGICFRESGKTSSAIGIGVAGQIDKTNGVVLQSPNLPTWHNIPLRARFEEAFNLPVAVNNDVRASTWGEWRHGAGKSFNDLVCIFVGTGVGG